MFKFKIILALFVFSFCLAASDQNTVTNPIGIELIRIEPGIFDMGSPAGSGYYDETRRSITISEPFYIGRTEITQAQYEKIMGANPSENKGENLPVEKISWSNAVEFCRRLSEIESKMYRLPTEAEWEYACRAGSDCDFSQCGRLDDMGWFYDNSGGKTHTIAKRLPNAWGIYDMHGNVSEWCSDFYDPDMPETETVDPKGPEQGAYRVIRGGSFDHFAPAARCAARSSAPASYQMKQTGFRIVMEIEK